MAFGSPYYQRKALTGVGYGQPAVNIQRPRAIELGEVSERYGEMGGGPSITPTKTSTLGGVGGGEGGNQAVMTEGKTQPTDIYADYAETLQDNPSGWRDIAYVATGLVKPSSEFPTITDPYAKGALSVAQAGVNYASKGSGIGLIFGPFVRGILAPLLATAFPSLSTKGYGASSSNLGADIAGLAGITAAGATAAGTAAAGMVGTGVGYGADADPNPSSDLSVADAMGMLGPGAGAGVDTGWGGGSDTGFGGGVDSGFGGWD